MATTAKIHTLSNEGKINKGREVKDLAKNSKWKIIIPFRLDNKPHEPVDLLAFSDQEIKYFKNDGTGKYSIDENWNSQKNSQDALKELDLDNLKLYRNIAPGHFISDKSIEFMVRDSGDILSIWQVTENELIQRFVFQTEFPWDKLTPDLQQMVAGRFLPNSMNDDLFFYQGNKNQQGSTGVMQLLLGRKKAPRFVDFRSTWTSIVPVNFRGDNLTSLLLFDDGDVVENHRGRRFETFPYTGPNPTSPSLELRIPTPRGHLQLRRLEPQPKETPHIRSDENNNKIFGRQLAALIAPFIKNYHRNIFKRADPDNRDEVDPEIYDWWNGGKNQNYATRFIPFLPPDGFVIHDDSIEDEDDPDASRKGYIIQLFCRRNNSGKDTAWYRVLNHNFYVLFDNDEYEREFPEKRSQDNKLPKLVINGNFSNASEPEFLFYSP